MQQQCMCRMSKALTKFEMKPTYEDVYQTQHPNVEEYLKHVQQSTLLSAIQVSWLTQTYSQMRCPSACTTHAAECTHLTAFAVLPYWADMHTSERMLSFREPCAWACQDEQHCLEPEQCSLFLVRRAPVSKELLSVIAASVAGLCCRCQEPCASNAYPTCCALNASLLSIHWQD